MTWLRSSYDNYKNFLMYFQIDPTSPFVSPPSHETDERIASQQDHDAAMRMEIEMEGCVMTNPDFCLS